MMRITRRIIRTLPDIPHDETTAVTMPHDHLLFFIGEESWEVYTQGSKRRSHIRGLQEDSKIPYPSVHYYGRHDRIRIRCPAIW